MFVQGVKAPAEFQGSEIPRGGGRGSRRSLMVQSNYVVSVPRSAFPSGAGRCSRIHRCAVRWRYVGHCNWAIMRWFLEESDVPQDLVAPEWT